MRIISRYLVTRFLKYFAAILFASTTALVIVEMLLNFDDMLKTDPDPSGIFTYLLLRIPSYYLRDLIPISLFGAALGCLGITAKWLESTAIAAGGISPQRAYMPVLAAGALIAALGFVFNETVVIRASRAWEQLEHGEGSVVAFRQGSFWYHSGHTIYNVREADSDERTLRGVRIYNRDARGRLLSSIHADRVTIEDRDHWLLEEATLYYFDPERSDEPTRVERHVNLRQAITDRNRAALLTADTDALSLPTVLEFIDAKPSRARVQRLKTQFHSRLAEPFVALGFVLVAMALGLRVERTRSLAAPAVAGVGLISVYYLVQTTTYTLASEGVLPATTVWSLVAALGLAGAWSYVRSTR